ncbi:hypothetical protein FRC11_008868 [Ceratobasidium sp. 423]|nr:hypothetical protein FRC11_008868 [Ceratobasidium sp. 423]
MSDPEFSTDEVANASDRTKNFKVITTNFPATIFPIGINLLNIQKKCNPRIRAYVDNVAPADSNYSRFIGRINLDTWGDTRLIAAKCTWLDTSMHSLDFQFGSFSSGKMSGADATGSKTIDIQFTRPYQIPPKVVIWLTALESDCSTTTRLGTSVDNVTTTGFRLCVYTWYSSIVYDATVSWIAVPSDNPVMTAGRFMAAEAGPSKAFQQKLIFDKPFKRIPRVMAALNKLDINHNANLRIAAYPKDITTEGMTLVLETWDDSIIYAPAVGYIAIDDAPTSSKSIFNLVARETTDSDAPGFSVLSRELKYVDMLKVVEGVSWLIFDKGKHP